MLTFKSFDIEAHPECRYDYVKVSFGSDEQKYCGSNKPSPIISSDNRMTVIFRSDEIDDHNNGFKATWKAVQPGMLFGVTYLLWSDRYWGLHYTTHQDIDKRLPSGSKLRQQLQPCLAVYHHPPPPAHRKFTRQCALRHIQTIISLSPTTIKISLVCRE